MNLLTILISTMNDGIARCINATQIIHPEIQYLIVHQNHNSTIIPKELLRDDIKIIRTKSKGLSNSRNIGLQNCQTKYALIADDDITYIEENLIEILDLLRKEDSDIYLFKIKTKEGEPEYKNYPDSPYTINDGAKHWFSSVEILINVPKIKNRNIQFDHRFGLGTLLRKGEEKIFIHDAISKGLVVKFFPIYLPNHPFESSGKKEVSDKFNYFYRGALNHRLKGTFPIYFSDEERTLKNPDYYHYKLGILYMQVTGKSRLTITPFNLLLTTFIDLNDDK